MNILDTDKTHGHFLDRLYGRVLYMPKEEARQIGYMIPVVWCDIKQQWEKLKCTK
jgi:hypothetical protein